MAKENEELRRKIADLEGRDTRSARGEGATSGKIDLLGYNGEDWRVLKSEAGEIGKLGQAAIFAYRTVCASWRSAILRATAEVREGNGSVYNSGTILIDDNALRSEAIRRSIDLMDASLERLSGLDVFKPELFALHLGQVPSSLSQIEVQTDFGALSETGKVNSENSLAQCFENWELLWVRVVNPAYAGFFSPAKDRVLSASRTFTLAFKIIWSQMFYYRFIQAMSRKITAESGEVVSLIGLRSHGALRDRLIGPPWTVEFMRDLVDSVAEKVGLTKEGQLKKKVSVKEVAPSSPAKGTRAATKAAAVSVATATNAKTDPDYCVFELLHRLKFTNASNVVYRCTDGSKCLLASLVKVGGDSGFHLSATRQSKIVDAINACTPWPPN